MNGPAILVANHANFFDPMWIYFVIDRPMHSVATEELRKEGLAQASF